MTNSTNVHNNGGYVNLSGANYHTFRCTGIANCSSMLYFWQEAPWLPQYKKTQFETFSKALALLRAKRHLTAAGTAELVELVYGMSEKGTRKYSKETYIKWGQDWLIRHNYND